MTFKHSQQAKKPDSIVKTSFDMPLSLRTALKLKAVSEGQDMKDIVIALISAYIDGKIDFKQLPKHESAVHEKL